MIKVSTGVGKGAKDQTRLRIEKMEAEREERRRLMQEVSKQIVLVPFHFQKNAHKLNKRENWKEQQKKNEILQRVTLEM